MSEVVERVVTETLASGVAPLRRVYSGVYDGYGEAPIAYVTETQVFTTETGIITGYVDAIERSEVGIRWSVSNIKNAFRTVAKLVNKDVRPAFVTAPVTESFMKDEVITHLDNIDDYGYDHSSVCLTFSEKAVIEGGSKVAEGIAAARSMGYQTAIADFSGAQSLAAMTEVKVDVLFFAPSLTASIGDRNKPDFFAALIGLVKSLRMEIILTGVDGDDEIREATAAECFGVMPSDNYSGEFSFSGKRDLEEIERDGEAA